jgi:hypothetical protein
MTQQSTYTLVSCLLELYNIIHLFVHMKKYHELHDKTRIMVIELSHSRTI